MYPFTYIFSRSTRPPSRRDYGVLDEEYEWVFGRRASNHRRQNRKQPGNRD